MLSNQTIMLITGAFAANGIELNEAGLAVIEASLFDQDEALVKQAVTHALKSGNRMSLAEINKQLSELKGERVSKKDATALAERAYALLRFPQRNGSSDAHRHDSDAYALLMHVGCWYDIHNRSEYDSKQLRADLKEMAPNAIKERQQAALLEAKQSNILPASKTQEQLK